MTGWHRLHRTAAPPLVVHTWEEVVLECKRVSAVPPLPVSLPLGCPVRHLAWP